MGGSLLLDEIDDIPENLRQVFVETGTYKGCTTRLVAPFFNKVITIEISKKLFLEALDSFLLFPNIIPTRGSSVDVLDRPDIRDIYKTGAVFFLDAHISGWDSSYDPELRVPLLEELSIINKEPLGESFFIIDDLRLWKSGNWPFTSEQICQQFKPNQIIKTYEKNDRYWIHTRDLLSQN